MYYKCNACQKVWYYPIQNCLFCHQKVERIYPTKFGVRGITTVEVPSREHEKVPYHVLLLEDEYGQTHSRKTFKKYNVGDTISEPTTEGHKHAVTVSKVRYDINEALKRVFDIMGESPFKRNMQVLFKLSLKEPAAYNSGRVTNVKLVRKFVEKLLYEGLLASKIILADRLPPSTDEAKILKKTGVAALCDEFGLNFVNLTGEQHETIPYGDVLFDVPKVILNTNLIVNLPCFFLDLSKANAPTTRNLLDIFPGQSLSKLKALTQQGNDVLPETISILDARLAKLKTQAGEKTIRPKVVFISQESLALDKALSKLYHFETEDVVDTHSYELVGEEFEVLEQNFGS